MDEAQNVQNEYPELVIRRPKRPNYTQQEDHDEWEDAIDLDKEGSDEEKPKKKVKGDKEKRVQARNFSWTLNNPVRPGKDDPERMLERFKAVGAVKLVFQVEKGLEGTIHYQGAVVFKTAKDFTKGSILKNEFPAVHWEKSRGDWESNLKYCTKEDTRMEGPWFFGCEMPIPAFVMEERLPLEKFRNWQKKCWDAFTKDPTVEDDRTIHWYYEATGGAGKSMLCWELVRYWKSKDREALVVSGKAADIKACLAIAASKGKFPPLVIWDVPRTVADYINYSALEEVKNRLFFSPKYESSMVAIPPVHCVVFANVEPDYSKLSGDRWNVQCIENDWTVPVIG